MLSVEASGDLDFPGFAAGVVEAYCGDSLANLSFSSGLRAGRLLLTSTLLLHPIAGVGEGLGKVVAKELGEIW